MTKGYRLPDDLTGYDLDYVCIPVPQNQEYRIAFWGQMLELTRWWVWEHDGTNRAKTAADYWLSFLQTAYENSLNGNGCIVQLRANPIEPCELQYSTDGGVTWNVGFDYAACLNDTGIGIANEISTEINVNVYIDNITTIYDNDYTNIAPGMTYGGSGSDNNRNKALCNALSLLVNDFALLAIDYAKERFEKSQEIPSLVALALGAAAVVSSAFVTPAGGALLYVSLGTALASIGLEAWLIADEADFSAYENQDAIDDVACYMYEQMKGNNPTAASFAAALAGETLTGDAEIIADALAPTLADEDTYVLLLQYMQDSLDLIAIGADIHCGCPVTGPWAYEFLAGLDSWQPEFWTLESGTYDAGNDRLEGEPYGAPPWERAWAKLEGLSGTTITKVQFTYDLDFSATVNLGQAIYLNGTNVSSVLENSDSTGNVLWTGSVNPSSVWVSASAGGTNGYARITNLIIEGSGIDPFA